MPPPLYRKVAYSGKKKRDQMLQKRIRKEVAANESQECNDISEEEPTTGSRKLNEQPCQADNRNKNLNRYNFEFNQESKRTLKQQLDEDSYAPLKTVTPMEREIGDDLFKNYDFPIRPEWKRTMNKKTFESNENVYFKDYIQHIQQMHRDENVEFSIFELNLETWRQLWRVLELSDILLIIVDARYPTLMFPPSLYKYIVNTLKKHAILVLNKVDLVPPEVVVAWRHYFHETYHGLPIVLFASYPSKSADSSATHGSMAHKRSMEGVYNIYRECQKIVQSKVDLSTWERKILEDTQDRCVENESTMVTMQPANKIGNSQQPHAMFHDGLLSLGCIGFPNVGKSSLINALKGSKVVSVSCTPGHTKHFQTIFLTNEVRLCDCPGLVFPSATPKYLQVLLESYPVSQLQVPYGSLKFLSEHLNLSQVLKLNLPDDFEEWSAAAVADAWALKRGFLVAKAAHPDRYRSANNLLRMCLAGRDQLRLQFYPPGFNTQKDKWLLHPEMKEVEKYQNSHNSNYSSTNKYEQHAEEEQELSLSDSLNAFALLGDN